MTAKELLLVLVVAGAAGAAAALAAGIVDEPAPTPSDPASAKILERLDRIENAIAASREDATRAREAAADLAERVASVETAQRTAAPGGVPSLASPEAGRPGRAARPRISWGGKEGEQVISLGAGEPLKLEGGVALTHVLPTIEHELSGIGDELRGMSNGFRLRGLPEDKRWEQAKADVGLSDTQVENLKRAVEERDAAMKDAFAVEEETSAAGGATLSIRRMDPEKASTAQANYRKKVDDTLDQTQRKSWREKGYDHAFGKHGAGGGNAVFVARSIEVHDDSAAPKDGK